MEFLFSPKRLVVAVAAALPLMASAADTPSTATARKGFAGYDHPNQYLVKPDHYCRQYDASNAASGAG
ncbi:TPA: hypothetical protein KML37_004004 [Escherichia coli]|nr:hypothetical protein [Escherichia coli]QME91007.1 hypothetical protein HVZ02_14325 [Escherichia coli]HBE6592276.1 hypothetical protein [Escherichia coli]